ncbi:MarR family winged helix-turn-helix transcriptional regulator [Kribbella kalugense]|uniref:DNA-binding MarR family transcriptional regulator n=1 Tax=Kribbella kalugense TaxID=2512221 RepID=A0A4R7ZEA6_9ACTN|nr:MarR family winged helix-turn-helix transcriptional regulator [Kribbella kalugense]TDW15582.1 DNA-binding MarR family transcriptional regulator [Kribbella kalugense]
MSERPDPVDVGLHYLAVGHFLRKVVDDHMTAGGLSLARSKVLEVLTHRSPLQQSALAEALGHAPRSVTQAVEALEREGLVERTTSAEDRRSKLVTLTPPGATALAAGATAGHAVLSEIFGALPDAELVRLDTLLAAIDTAMSAQPKGKTAEAR